MSTSSDLKNLLDVSRTEVKLSGVLDISGKPVSQSVADVLSWINKNKPRQLYFDNCDIDDDTVHEIFNYLKFDTSVCLISLRGNRITNHGVYCIIKSLSRNENLTCIDLLRNPIDDTSELTDFLYSSLHLRSVCGIWSRCRQLTVRNPLQLIDADLIAADIRKSTDMAYLELNGSDNINKILVALEDNTSLVSLKVMNTVMDGQLTEALSKMLRTNSTIKSFSLQLKADLFQSATQIYLQNLSSILSSLRTNIGITTFRIENFDLPIEACQSLANLLKFNTTIVHLVLISCHIVLEGLASISSGLEQNRTLKNLRLVGTDDFSAKEINFLDRSVTKRNAPLILRLGNTEYSFGGESYQYEWEVDDLVEAYSSDRGGYDVCKVVAVGRTGDSCHVLFDDGEENVSVQMSDIRKGQRFSRIESLCIADDHIGDMQDDKASVGLVTDTQIIKFDPDGLPIYRIDDAVDIRFYGDSTWYNAKITNIKRQEFFDVSLDDDDALECDIEIHMMRHREVKFLSDEEAVTASYDAGCYQRGDYVEVNLTSINWKRGRVAIENCNGAYDVRLEDGTDIQNIPGRRLRPLFRNNDRVIAICYLPLDIFIILIHHNCI